MQVVVLPILLLAACAVGLAAVLLESGRLFSRRRPSPVKRMPYESGMDPIHDTRRRFDIRYHLLAIAFLVFDVEMLFLYPWAVARQAAPDAVLPSAASKAAPLGIDAAVSAGWIESRGLVFGGVMAFIVLLALGFIYDWRKGMFRWR
jgi:NADH-quinone oxidoreductase subunit A